MKKSVVLFAVALLLMACGGRSMSPEALQQKLDSVKALEIKEKLELQGINLESADNPMKAFYDSLNIQPLPISYSEDYVNYLPDYTEVTPDIASYMNLVDCKHPKAIALPESLGARLIIIATDEEEGIYSLWLFSLDNDFFPVDKLCLYAVAEKDDEEFLSPDEDAFVQYFSITSDYEIRLLDYSKDRYKARLEEVYYIDDARKFFLRSTKEE